MADDKKAKTDDKELKATGAPEGGEAAEGADPTEETAGQGKFTPKKIILFVVLPLFLIIAGGSAAYFSGLLDKFLPHKELKCESVKEGDKDFEACAAIAAAHEAGKNVTFMEVPPMIVNLSASGRQQRFLKISLKIELADALDQPKLEPMMPRVVDQFQMYLRELRLEDLRGSSGIYRMKIELLSRVRAAAPGIKVNDVLFQEVLVQ